LLPVQPYRQERRVSTIKTEIMAKPATDSFTVPGAIRHELVNRLLADIFEGRLPTGAHLVMKNLTERFGLSSTPIRESLLELEAIGVVEFVHNRGAVVRPFGEEQLREIFQLRRILEVEATRCACRRAEIAELAQVKEDLLALAEQKRGKAWLEHEMALD
jgi:DNA-binding GntR family transcriptional regulator